MPVFFDAFGIVLFWNPSVDIGSKSCCNDGRGKENIKWAAPSCIRFLQQYIYVTIEKYRGGDVVGRKQYRSKTSLKSRLIISFVITSIIPIILLNLFSYYNTSGIVRDNVDELTQMNVQQTRTSLDVWMDSYEDVLFQVYMDDNIVELVKKLNQQEDLSASRSQLRRMLRGMFYTKEYVKCITVLMNNGDIVFYDLLTGSMTQNSWLNDFSRTPKELYERISQDNNTHVISTEKAKTINAQDNYLFHLGHRIIDYKNVEEQLGVVIVSVDEQLLKDVCSSNEKDANSFNFIVDSRGNLVSYRSDEQIGRQIVKWSDDVKERQTAYAEFIAAHDVFSGEYSTVFVSYAHKMGWDVVNVTNQNEVMSRLKGQQQIMMVVLGLSLGALLILIVIFIQSLSGALHNLAAVMKQAGRGNLTVRMEMDKKMSAEVEIIANKFNTMLGELGDSLEKENAATKRQKDAEIAALEAQINPHFLYNTLDTINWMAIDHNEFEISNAIGALATILRYGIDNSNSMVTVRQECDWLRQYLFLQQTRMKNTFECEIHVEPETMEMRIHKLLLQPFVENSIIHGFEGVSRTHHLKVNITFQEGQLDMVIYDNGKGISEETMAAMNRGIFEKTMEKNHIGMENAITRIKMYYEQAQVEIQSAIGEFTQIHIQIPVHQLNEH